MQSRIPLAWGFFLLAIGVTIAGILIFSPAPVPSSELLVDPRVQTFEAMKADGGQGIYVEDQPAGVQEVQIGFAVCSSPCFVAIFDDASGVPGKPIGVSALLPEGGEHVRVSLETPLLNDAVYYAMLRKDNGDGTFLETTDGPLANAGGVTALMTFLAKEGAAPEMEAVMP